MSQRKMGWGLRDGLQHQVQEASGNSETNGRGFRLRAWQSPDIGGRLEEGMASYVPLGALCKFTMFQLLQQSL